MVTEKPDRVCPGRDLRVCTSDLVFGKMSAIIAETMPMVFSFVPSFTEE